MKYNNPLEIATITTKVLAHYIYQAISDLEKKITLNMTTLIISKTI